MREYIYIYTFYVRGREINAYVNQIKSKKKCALWFFLSSCLLCIIRNSCKASVVCGYDLPFCVWL